MEFQGGYEHFLNFRGAAKKVGIPKTRSSAPSRIKKDRPLKGRSKFLGHPGRDHRHGAETFSRKMEGLGFFFNKNRGKGRLFSEKINVTKLFSTQKKGVRTFFRQPVPNDYRIGDLFHYTRFFFYKKR